MKRAMRKVNQLIITLSYKRTKHYRVVSRTTYFRTILKSTAVVRITKLENNTAMAWEQKEEQLV